MVFTTLAHHMDEAFLTEALHQLRKDAAAGIDEMTVAEYSQNLKKIFLHTVLDEGFKTTVRSRMGGDCFLVRFADDFALKSKLPGHYQY